MRTTYCYWTVADGDYAEMMKTTIRSARRVGVFKDFHVWSDRQVEGAINHPAGKFDKPGCIFKLTFLREAVQKLNYDYFVWLDTDMFFVRNPGDVLRVLQGSPVHVSLECDLCSPLNQRPDWWGCPNAKFASLMRAKGVCSRAIFNCNGGFWIVHHDVIETFFQLTFDFWHFCRDNGHIFTEEPLLSYALHMLCGNPYEHTLRQTADLWASDWTGCFRDVLPDGQAWWHIDYFTGEKIPVNPAIVHCMRSKAALVAEAAKITTA